MRVADLQPQEALRVAAGIHATDHGRLGATKGIKQSCFEAFDESARLAGRAALAHPPPGRPPPAAAQPPSTEAFRLLSWTFCTRRFGCRGRWEAGALPTCVYPVAISQHTLRPGGIGLAPSSAVNSSATNFSLPFRYSGTCAML